MISEISRSSSVRDEDTGSGMHGGGNGQSLALGSALGTADQPFVIDDDDDGDALDLQKPAAVVRSPTKAAA